MLKNIGTINYSIRIEHPVVTLCGSTKFRKQFEILNEELTKLGYVVLAPGAWGHSGSSVTDEEKVRLDSLHKYKIALSDFVVVVNVDGYIGESTKSEIAWAERLDIPVYFCYNKENEKKEH